MHGRTVDAQLEKAIIQMLRDAIVQQKRPERLIIFNGMVVDDKGDEITMPFAQQFDIFNSAILVVGPHGSGLANNVWLASQPAMEGNCLQRPSVIEFLDGDAGVQFRQRPT